MRYFLFSWFLVSFMTIYAQKKSVGDNGLTLSNGSATKQQDTISSKDGSGSLGNIYTYTDCGLDYVQATHVLDTRNLTDQQNYIVSSVQPAPYDISGIPACATVVKAFVWWSTSGSNSSGSVTVQNPSGSSSTYNVSAIGTGVDKCWGGVGKPLM